MSVTKIKTKDGEIRWEVRVYVDGRGSKRIRRRFEKKIDAEIFLFDSDRKKEEVSRSVSGESTFEGRYFFTEADEWLEENETRFSVGHLIKARAVLKWMKETYGNILVQDVTAKFLTKYQREELGRGSSPATVNRKTEIMMAILNSSVRARRIPFNPAVGFRKLPKKQPEMKFWTESEAKSFLASMNLLYPLGSSRRWRYLAYLVAISTGLRAGELWGLRKSDIDEPRQVLKVQRQYHRITRTFEIPKGKKPRSVPLVKEAIKELKVWCAQMRIGNNDTIFMTINRDPIRHDRVTKKLFPQDVKKWGGRKIRFHDLRHTAISLLITKGVDLKTVQVIAGHQNVTTTMEYSHLAPSAVNDVINKLNILS